MEELEKEAERLYAKSEMLLAFAQEALRAADRALQRVSPPKLSK